MKIPVINAMLSVTDNADMYSENDMLRLCFCTITWNGNKISLDCVFERIQSLQC